jgi:hypothetical protein
MLNRAVRKEALGFKRLVLFGEEIDSSFLSDIVLFTQRSSSYTK